MMRTHSLFILVLVSGLVVGGWSAVLAQKALPLPKGSAKKPVAAPVLQAPGPDTARIGALAKAYGDSVVVRWATDNALFWQANVRNGGYMLTRYTVSDDKKITRDFRLPIAPWTLNEWKQKAGPRDTLAGVCVQMLYGKREALTQENISLDAVVQQKNTNDMRLMFALVQADLNPRHARGMGLGYVDKQVKRGETYLYTVSALKPLRGYPADTGRVVAINDGKIEPIPPMIPVQAEVGDRTVKLKWERETAEGAFTAYYIEKSTDGGRTFRRLMRLPWIQPVTKQLARQFEYNDSLAANYRPYQYRVIGLTPFGEFSQPSPVVVVRGIDRTPPKPVSGLQAKHLSGSRVRLSWKESQIPADFAGYLVAKATSVKGPFTPLSGNRLLGAGQHEFIDTTALPQLEAYYVVVSVDTAKNGGTSLPAYCIFRDKKGPAQPKGLQGYIDTTGAVRIVWDANTESDLLGYKVWRANDSNHVFVPVTGNYLSVSVFNDKTLLNTLTKHLYYRVVAYDKEYNPSVVSTTLQLTRPDVVRPVAPVIKNYVASDTAIQLIWVRSSSDDVAGQRLLRRGATTERWQELAKLPPGQTTYADLTVKPNKTYQYGLIAIDSAGLQSPESFPLTVNTLNFLPREVKALNASVAPDAKSVVLNWKYPVENCRFVIYRASNPNPLRSYDAVNRELTFTDKAIQKGQYEYAVKVIYQDGRESGLSNRVKIDVK